MAITYLSDNPLTTSAHVLLFGTNAQGRIEQDALTIALHARCPTAFAAFSRQCRADKISAGKLWYWWDCQPALGFMVIRESPFGATRLRYVESVIMGLARDYQRDGVKSAALILPPTDQDDVKALLDRWFGTSALAVSVYAA
ncbi:MAG: hypothetical protein IAE80_20110 [Anaerolinea sp.]|nr:hypothetical protein [Anaerolinea sp.]